MPTANDDQKLPDATPDRDYDTVAETPQGADAADRPKVPTTLPPQGACDCGVMLPSSRGAGPEWIDGLRARLSTIEIDRAVLVCPEGAFQSDAAAAAAFREMSGDTRLLLPLDPTRETVTLDRDAEGVVAGLHVRDPDAALIAAFGPRLADRDMILEITCDDPRPIAEAIRDCPAEIVLNGIGPISGGTDDAAFRERLSLLRDGAASVKLCGFASSGDAPWSDAHPFLAALSGARAEGCLWASGNPDADPGLLLDAFFEAVEDPQMRQTILVDAPARLYRFAG